MSAAHNRRLSPPLVLAAASTMICIGVVAIYSNGRGEGRSRGDARTTGPSVALQVRTPEAAAESFLDAWRKRAHDTALRISVGTARREVLERKRRDDRLGEPERELKEQVWDHMARSRLRLAIDESETLSEGHVRLGGMAQGEFMGRPYERLVQFVVRRDDDEWRVEQMQLGEILTEMPELLELDPAEGTPPGSPPDGP